LPSAPRHRPACQPLTAEDPREVGGYTIHGRLGAGGMGSVFLATNPDGKYLALKMIRPDLASSAEFRLRFEQEAKTAQLVKSDYTATVVAADPASPVPWLATAYISGQSLAERVAASGPLPNEQVRELGIGVAQALEAIHSKGIVHRDLKPSNVLLTASGAKVIDFGIARAPGSTELTATGQRIGSVQFMSPEQVYGQPATTASDIFAFGSLLYFAATGLTPFGSGSAYEICNRIVGQEPALDRCPAEFRPLVRACLAKNQQNRPKSPAIVGYLGPDGGPFGHFPLPSETDTATRTISAGPRPGRPQRPARALTGSRAGIVLLAVAVIIGSILLGHQLGSGSSSSAGRAPRPTLQPSSYAENDVIYQGQGWLVKLTSIQVDNGMLIANVTYLNQGSAEEPSCAGYSDPGIDTLSIGDGPPIPAVQTFCSQNPDAQWAVPSGGSFRSYAKFPVSAEPDHSFTLTWQEGMPVSGSAYSITIP
jgi:serine/threonine protein kinase